MHPTPPLSRRDFLATLTAAASASLLSGAQAGDDKAQSAGKKIKLGIDNFAVRAMGWKAPALIDYAASLKLDTLFITDLDAFESLEPAHLADVKARAADKGLEIYAGSWSICPTSKVFKNNWGTAEEHLALGIRVAKAVGSPVIRVILGNGGDRLTEGGIPARIADTVKTLKACRSQAMDAGIKIAVENHGGDMQSWELVGLIEEAGKEYVGANVDSGNATWTMEDPLVNLENLAPYALSTSLRDSAIWESPQGATIQWTAMGDGDIDLPVYFKRFAELCPQVPVNIETISGFNREIPYLTDAFWKAYPEMKARDLARFLIIAKRGKPRQSWTPPAGKERKLADQEYQKQEIERSIRYCKETLGLGVRS